MNARRIALPLLALAIATACGEEPRPAASAPTPTASTVPEECTPPNEEAAVTDHWPVPIECDLLPYPYVTPTPAAEPSELDGVYERMVTDAIAGHGGKCRRCPPYRMERGETNVLMLTDGVFRVVHRPGEFRSVGHFEVEGDAITLWNDPNCPQARGTYTWRLDGDTLHFEVVEEGCSFGGLRTRYLTATSWTRSAPE